MEDVYHMTLVSWPKLPWVSSSSVSSGHSALVGRTWIFPSQAVCVTYWINIFLIYLLRLKFTITFLSLRMTFHCMEKNFLSINSFFVWRPAPIFKIWLYQHALGLMPKTTEFDSVDPLNKPNYGAVRHLHRYFLIKLMYHSIEGVSFPGHLSLFLWKITQNDLNVLIISNFWEWLDWCNSWPNVMPYCWIIVRILISLKAGKVSDKIKKLVNTKMIFNKSSDVMMTSFITKQEVEAPPILDPPFWII